MIVFTKWFDSVSLGEAIVHPCKIQIGAMDYGIDIQGIIGFDFVRAAGLIIDAEEMMVYSKTEGIF